MLNPYQSAPRRHEALSGVASNSAPRSEAADIAREIYRAAEQESWSKDKLFKMLADPSKFKRHSRYHNKVIFLNVNI
jgi:hypothetical protein